MQKAIDRNSGNETWRALGITGIFLEHVLQGHAEEEAGHQQRRCHDEARLWRVHAPQCREQDCQYNPAPIGLIVRLVEGVTYRVPM